MEKVEQNIRQKDALFIGGIWHGQRQRDVLDFPLQLRVAVPPKGLRIIKEDEDPFEKSYKEETYVRCQYSWGEYYYVEEGEYSRKRKLEQIDYHRKKIHEYYEAIHKLKQGITI